MAYSSSVKTGVVRCKHCEKNIPVPCEGLPPQPVLVHCPLCTERRFYLPSEVFFGAPAYEITKLQRVK